MVEGKWVPGPEVTTCHIIVTDGVVNFMTDDPHLPGQQRPLPDYPDPD